MLASLRTTTILVVLGATAIVSAHGVAAGAPRSHKHTTRARKHPPPVRQAHALCGRKQKQKHGRDARANKRRAVKHRRSVKCAAAHNRSGRPTTPLPRKYCPRRSTLRAHSRARRLPPLPAPTASFTYSPASPQVGQPVEFDATDSTCPDGPCAYEWSDDGGPTRPIPAQWPLGSGQTMAFTFHEAATKYVRLVLTDVLGRTHNRRAQRRGLTRTAPLHRPSTTAGSHGELHLQSRLSAGRAARRVRCHRLHLPRRSLRLRMVRRRRPHPADLRALAARQRTDHGLHVPRSRHEVRAPGPHRRAGQEHNRRAERRGLGRTASHRHRRPRRATPLSRP